MKTEPQKEHTWLQKLIGEWTCESEAVMAPDQPPIKTEAIETVRSIGGLWIVAEGHGAMPDGNPAHMILTLGYDPRKKRYVGTWLGSMMTHLWVYSGTLDESGRVLTLDTEGPSMLAEGETARYQDVIELVNDDHRIMRSQALGSDGQWQQFMTAHYHRKK